jgi:hypothetical protein
MAGDREPGPLFASTAIREVLASWIVLLLALALGLFLLAFRADGPRDHAVEAVMQPWEEPDDPPAGDPEPGNGVLCRDPTCALSQGADPTAQTGSNAASHRSFGR